MMSPQHNLTLTRRVAFSSGHRYWNEAWSDAENRERFGPFASKFNHGHNYVMDVAVSGVCDPSTSMVVNIKSIDDILQDRFVDRFHLKSLNDEVPELIGLQTSLENILRYVWSDLSHPGILPPEVDLVRIRLEEMPTLWAEIDMHGTTLSRSYEFAAAHRLHVPSLSEEKNFELFGKCTNPAGHGHNYLVEVTISGDVDPATGMMADIALLDRKVNELIIERYDHKNLNVDIPEFAGKTTTSEVLALEIFTRLNGQVPGKLVSVRLFETARSVFEVRAQA